MQTLAIITVVLGYGIYLIGTAAVALSEHIACSPPDQPGDGREWMA